MWWPFLSFALFGCIVLAGTVQKPGLTLPSSANANRDAVQNMFTDSYNAYKQFAFGHDDLNPNSETLVDDRNGWGATIVDAMTTMSVMGLDDLFNEAVNFSSNIDFSHSVAAGDVSVFETTIRYLAALLSAYQLSDNQFPGLLEKAQQLGEKLAFAWTSSAIPFNNLDFSSNTAQVANTNIAQAGTASNTPLILYLIPHFLQLTLEFFLLSQLTGNSTYQTLAENAVQQIISLPTPFAGLAVQNVNPQNGQSTGGPITWGGGSDSYFEYLIKYSRLSNTDDNIFADTWAQAIDSSINHLLRTSTVGNFVYLADSDATGHISFVGSHLACFYGGNWLLGGKLLNNDTIVNLGLNLTDACWNTYASTATGIGPETFAFASADGGSIPSADDTFYNEHGFYITNGNYNSRPEVLESNFYAWRVSGDVKYLDRAQSALNSFNEFLTAKVGFAGFNDVNNSSGGQIDYLPSFWFAEVLKYLYLTFDDPNHISLDSFVFNTEAHPFPAPPAKSVYGSGYTNAAYPTYYRMIYLLPYFTVVVLASFAI